MSVSIKHQLQQLIDSHPKHWASYVAKNTSLMSCLAPYIEKYGISIQASVYCFINDVLPVCPNGRIKKFTWYKQGFVYCGTRDKCQCHKQEAVEKSRNTNLSKYGEISFAKTEDYRKKAKETNLLKFGVEQASWNSDVRSRAKATCLSRFGAEFPIQTEAVKKKLADTKFSKYGNAGFSNPAKRELTLVAKYGVHNSTYVNMSTSTLAILNNEKAFIEFITGKTRQYAAEIMQVDPNTITKYATLYSCFDKFTVAGSKWEDKVADYLKLLGVNFVRNERKKISPYELDFFLPEYNIAIEINGNYWHSELKKDKNYHFMKWQLCQQAGVDLYQFFEDEFEFHWPVICAKIKYLCKLQTTKIGARQVTLGEITYAEEEKFLNANHMQGSSTARNKSIAAYHRGELVGIMSWIKRSKYLEITRFAVSINLTSPGLFTKMLKAVLKKLDFSGDVISFSNNGHSNGNVYRSAGFVNDLLLGPAYWYMKNYSARENRQGYMKHKIQKKFNIDVSKNTEAELMSSLGYTRIWDSGKIRWKLTVNKGT